MTYDPTNPPPGVPSENIDEFIRRVNTEHDAEVPPCAGCELCADEEGIG